MACHAFIVGVAVIAVYYRRIQDRGAQHADSHHCDADHCGAQPDDAQPDDAVAHVRPRSFTMRYGG
jgi:hypothetical protein